jgi:ribosomal protein S18 acetylase RimI-like enzyme
MPPPPKRIVEVRHASPEYWATVELRKHWLRDPLGLRFTDEELASEGNSHHLACYQGDELVGCAVLRPVDGQTIQMRQVVVRPDVQRHGLGTALVEHSEALARRLGFSQMVLHARDAAVPFYERLAYEVVGEPFTEVTILHREMRKTLLLQSP